MTFRETETVELKAKVTDDIKKEIVAFANCEGGKLYIGIRDDGKILGLDDPDGTALQVSNAVRGAIKPDVTMFVHYETMDIEGQQILAVEIRQGTERPYCIAKKGLRPEGVYVRQGYSSVPASETMIRQMIKDTDGDYFEDMRSLNQDLTFEAAEKAFKSRNTAFGKSQMKTPGLMTHDGIYTNLGLVLSDQCVHTIKVAVFEGTSQNAFQDRKEFTGSLFQQMEDAYNYIDMKNQTHSTYDKLYRIDQRDYPESAVREALMNMLVHREYAIRASSFISFYADRLEFTSVGGLVNGVSVNDIMMGISVCRNVKLANVFYRLELIEAYGIRIQKIMEAYAESARKAEIMVSDNAFKIVLPNLNAPGGQNKKTARLHGQAESVISLAKSKGEFSRRDVQDAHGISQTSSGRLLKRMVDSGRLVQTGAGKNTRYHLTD